MNVYGIEVNIKNIPKLDPGFIPMSAFTRAFEKSAAGGKEIVIAVERNQGQVAVRRCRIHGTPDKADADRVYVDRTGQDAAVGLRRLESNDLRRRGAGSDDH